VTKQHADRQVGAEVRYWAAGNHGTCGLFFCTAQGAAARSQIRGSGSNGGSVMVLRSVPDAVRRLSGETAAG